MQHPDKHTCNIRLKTTDETLGPDTCNIRVQPLHHMQHPPIYLYNIHMKHMQHTSETSETLATCAFSVTSRCCLGEWRLVGVLEEFVGI
jgi:hypothetical protein